MPRSLLGLTLLPAVFLIAALIYVPALTGGFIFDDISNIVEQGTVKLPSLSAAYLAEAAFPLELGGGTRPLSRLSFALNWYATGMDPFAFKLVNLVLHGLNAVLVFLFLRRLLEMYQVSRPDASLPSPPLVAFVAALLWAVAPVHAYAVPYVVQRMVLLCGTFSLIALFAYLRLRVSASRGTTWSVLGWGSLAGLAALFAFLSKEIAIVLPVYVLVMEVTLLRAGQPGRAKPLVYILAVGALALPVLALGVYSLTNPQWLSLAYSQREFGPLERLMTESRVIMMYLSNTVLPRLGEIRFFNDSFPISRSLLAPPTTLASILAIGGLAAAALWTRGRRPLFAFAVLWFLGGHLLEGTLIPLELVFWHRNYLPSLGPLLLVAWGLAWLLTNRGAYYRAGYALVAAVALLFSGQTLVSAYTWGSPLRMAFAEYQGNPDSARANHEYARQLFGLFELTNEGRYRDQAVELFARSAQLDPLTLLPLDALIEIRARGYPIPFDPYDRMLHIVGSEAIRSENVSILDAMARRAAKQPDQVNFFDVLALYDALDANPRIARAHKARWMMGLAYLLTDSGLPVDQGLDVLRDARCRAPDDFAIRIRLLEGLTAAGYLDEAETLLATGFSPWERRVSVSTAYAEQLIAQRRAAAKGEAPPGVKSSVAP